MSDPANVPLAATPSEIDFSGITNQARIAPIQVVLTGNLSATTLLGGIIPYKCRIVGVRGFRLTAASGGGAGGATVVDVNRRILGGANASILSAPMSFANASGSALSVVGSLNTALTGYDDGVIVNQGDVISVDIDSIEAGATPPAGLIVVVQCQAC